MRGERVIAVDRVLGEQLPVGAHGIFLRAADDSHAHLGLIGDDVEIVLHRAEVAVEGLGIFVEADEAEVAESLESRHLLHVRGAALLEIRCIGSLARLAAQRTVEAKHPTVIEALEGFCIAKLLAADLSAAMRTGVEHGAQRPFCIAREQDAAAADLSGDEISGLGQLGGVAEIEPALFEDARALGFEDVGIDKRLPRDLEDLPGLVNHERGVHAFERVHCTPSLEILIAISMRPGGRNAATPDRRATAWRWRR